MRKIVLLLLFVLNLMPALYAQEQKKDTYYVKSVRIEDMRRHPKGYVVYYAREDGGIQRVFLPFFWFSGNRSGSLYFVNDPSNPTMSVFYKNGELDRIDITLNRDGTLPIYGVPMGETYKDSDFPTKKEKSQFVF